MESDDEYDKIETVMVYIVGAWMLSA